MAELGAYFAVAYQMPCAAVNRFPDGQAARTQMRATIDDLDGKIAATKRFLGPEVKLVVLPEYCLSGFPMGEMTEEWIAKAALAQDGPEYEALGAIASDNDLYLAGNAYECDPNFASLYFQTSFVIDPEGRVILRYRRLNSMFAATPYDVWDRYVALYGLEGVFPVAETPIGKLACIASEEILFPEIARCLALRGAEIFCHSTSEVARAGETPKQIARKARALENMAYVVSANSAGMSGAGFPEASTDGHSAILNPSGQVLAEAALGESMAGYGEIDLPALRRQRRRPGMGNLLARQRLEAFARSYSETVIQPANRLLGGQGELLSFEHSRAREEQMAVIRSLAERGII